MDLFDNQWVVGIGGGILSGLFVTYITHKFFSSKDNKEYLQKLNLANSEVIYAIKPFIVDGAVPDVSIISAMQSATARKYSLDLVDMASINDIIENLIKEIMDTSFISNNLKSEYCEKLSGLTPKPIDSEIIENHKNQAILEYRRRVLSAFSLLLGIFTGILTSYTVFMASASDSIIFSNFKILLPSFLSFFMAYVAFVFFKMSKKKEKNQS